MENDERVFQYFMEKNNKEMCSFFDSFINAEIVSDSDLHRRVIYVYKVYYSKMVEEEVEIQEQVSKSRSGSLIASSLDELYHRKKDKRSKKKRGKTKTGDAKETADKPGSDEEKTTGDGREEPKDRHDISEGGNDDKKQKHQKKKKKNLKYDNANGRLSPYTMMDNITGEGGQMDADCFTYITVKKTIQKVIEVPHFECFIGTIEDKKKDVDRCCLYFIRRCKLPVPDVHSSDEAASKMPFYFIVGSIGNNLLDDLKTALTLVFNPLFTSMADASLTDATAVKFQHLLVDKCAVEEFLNYQKPSYYYTSNVLSNCGITSEIQKDVFKDYRITISESNLFNIPSKEQLRVILKHQLNELLQHIETIEHEMERENRFQENISGLSADSDDALCLENPDLLTDVYCTVQTWMRQIKDILKNSTNAYNREENSLLYEYNYWKYVELEISRAVDDLSNKKVKRILNILRENNSTLYDEFYTEYSLLLKLYSLAYENVNSLSILQEYFQNLLNSSFNTITDKISQLIDKLKIIWILSKQYSSKENMTMLLSRIRWTLCWRVRDAFGVTILFKNFRNSPKLWKKMMEDAISMMKRWKCCYMVAKEESFDNCDNNYISTWDFNTDILFSETDYLILVLNDFISVIEILRNYEIVLNTKLKNILNQNDVADIELKIINAIALIEKVDFDIYAEIFKEEKEEVLQNFKIRIKDIDREIGNIILDRFEALKNIETGVECLQEIMLFESRCTVILDQIPILFHKIISLFSNEIAEAESAFNNFTSNCSADAIRWSKLLFDRLQVLKSQIQLLLANSTCAMAEYNKALDNFVNLKNKIDQFINGEIKKWCDETGQLFKNNLKRNAMKIVPAKYCLELNKISYFSENVNGAERISGEIMDKKVSQVPANFSFKTSMDAKLNLENLVSTATLVIRRNLIELKKEKLKKILEEAHVISWNKFIEDNILIERGYTFSVNFQENLFDKITEAKYLSSMEFELPTEINLLLTRGNIIKQNYHLVCGIVDKYARIMSDISPAQVLFMKNHLQDLELAIQPAVNRYTWSSLSIDHFADRLAQKLAEFSYLLSHVQKTFHSLDEKITSVEKSLLFFNEDLLFSINRCISYEDFFMRIDNYQKEHIDDIISFHDIIMSTLVRLEYIILKSNSGTSESMFYYYDKYECNMLRILIESTSNSLIKLKEFIDGSFGAHLIMNVSLSDGNGPVLSPSASELFDLIKDIISGLFNRLKPLRHWRKNSCICVNSDSEKGLFYDDLIVESNVKNCVTLVMSSAENLCHDLIKITNRWKTYRNMWTYNKDDTLRKFIATKPNLTDYESKFNFYSNVIVELEEINSNVDVGCIRVCQEKIIEQIIVHCKEWKEKLGSRLIENTEKIICDVSDRINRFQEVLNKQIGNENSLIEILQTIQEVQNSTTDVEFRFQEIHEQLHELSLQSITIRPADVDKVEQLKLSWHCVYDKSLYKKFSLTSLKEVLQPKMESKQTNFIHLCNQFVRSFYDNYPVKFETDFNTCIQLLREFSAEFEQIESAKQDIDKLQYLFDLYPINYEALTKCYVEFSKLRNKFIS